METKAPCADEGVLHGGGRTSVSHLAEILRSVLLYEVRRLCRDSVLFSR